MVSNSMIEELNYYAVHNVRIAHDDEQIFFFFCKKRYQLIYDVKLINNILIWIITEMFFLTLSNLLLSLLQPARKKVDIRGCSA